MEASNEQNFVKYYVVIDVEAHTNEDITAIGLVLADSLYRVHLKKEWWMICDERKIAKITKEEFWSKHMDVWREGQKAARPEEEQIKDFVLTLDSISDTYGIDDNDIIYVSDNPEFDFGRLSPYVKKYCNREPIRYRTNKKSRPIIDYSDALWKLGIYRRISDRVAIWYKPDHFPSHDALHNWVVHMISEKIFDAINMGIYAPMEFIADACTNEVLVRLIGKTPKEWVKK